MRFILWSVDWEATSSLLQPAFVLVAPGFRESGIAASTRLKSNPAKHPKRTALQHANAVNACTVNAVFLSAYTRHSSESRIRPLPCLALRYLFCPGPMNSSQNGEKHSNHRIKAFDTTHQILSGFAGCMPHASPSPVWP